MLKTFSSSAMDMYLKCGTMFECHYIKGIPGRLSGNLIRGSAYHNALGMALSEQVVYKTLPILEQVVKVYEDTWDTSVRRKSNDDDGKLVGFKDIDWGKDTPENMKAEGKLVVEKYYREQLHLVNPREVEAWKRITYKGIPLVGKVDVITQDYKIIDHKTSDKLASSAELEKETQSSWYAILCGMSELEFELHQAVIKKVPEIKVWQLKRTADQIKWVAELIEKTWSAINQGIFLPTGKTGWWCGPQECAYWDICHHKEIKSGPVAPADF